MRKCVKGLHAALERLRNTVVDSNTIRNSGLFEELSI